MRPSSMYVLVSAVSNILLADALRIAINNTTN